VRSGDVGNWVVGEQPAGVHLSGVGTSWRTSLPRPLRPQAQVFENASGDCWILDTCAMKVPCHRPY